MTTPKHQRRARGEVAPVPPRAKSSRALAPAAQEGDPAAGAHLVAGLDVPVPTGSHTTAGAGPDIPEGGAATPGEGGSRSRPPGASPVADAMSEAELQEHIRRILAGLPGVLAYHTHDSRHSASGFPDWCFCGPGGVLFRELKREGKKPTPAQAQWLTALVQAGQNACVWWPHDLLSGLIARRLAELAGLGGAA